MMQLNGSVNKTRFEKCVKTTTKSHKPSLRVIKWFGGDHAALNVISQCIDLRVDLPSLSLSSPYIGYAICSGDFAYREVIGGWDYRFCIKMVAYNVMTACYRSCRSPRDHHFAKIIQNFHDSFSDAKRSVLFYE